MDTAVTNNDLEKQIEAQGNIVRQLKSAKAEKSRVRLSLASFVTIG